MKRRAASEVAGLLPWKSARVLLLRIGESARVTRRRRAS